MNLKKYSISSIIFISLFSNLTGALLLIIPKLIMNTSIIIKKDSYLEFISSEVSSYIGVFILFISLLQFIFFNRKEYCMMNINYTLKRKGY